MAVSRRLRFEILRRDGYTCRYCGAKAPDAVLTVDHVVPVALGGTDDPSNLVAACQPCNSGKSSIPADAALVDEVDATAMLFAQALEVVAARRARELKNLQFILGTFEDVWRALADDGEVGPMQPDWRQSIDRFLSLGLTDADLYHFAYVTGDSKVMPAGKWKYFCGCCWREISTRQEMARRLIEDGEV